MGEGKPQIACHGKAGLDFPGALASQPFDRAPPSNRPQREISHSGTIWPLSMPVALRPRRFAFRLPEENASVRPES